MLNEVTARHKSDIVVTSEPNINLIKNYTNIKDKNLDTAIIMVNKNIGLKEHGSGNGYTWVELEENVIYSCYFSPNTTLEEFVKKLTELGDSIRTQTKPVTITGDFNSKAPAWGNKILDKRGEKMSEWLAEMDFTVINEGKIPTFVRGNSSSYLDLTIADSKQINTIAGWKVLEEEESFSDHRYVTFKIQQETNTVNDTNKQKKWDIRKLKKETFIKRIMEETKNTEINTVEELINKIYKASNDSMPKIKTGKRKPIYW